MLVHFGTDHLSPEWPSAVVCIGVFDGVHLGHQAVIRQAVRIGLESEWPSIVVTFDRHPLATLAPERRPSEIAPLCERLIAIEQTGAAIALVLPFDRELANMAPKRFLDEILVGQLHAARIVVGHDFRFGHNRDGDGAWLAERIPTTVAPPFEVDGVRVSSTHIRRLVADGAVEEAGALLGRSFVVRGVVIGGQKLGRRLGYPTINLARSTAGLLPADGVYAGWCDTELGRYVAAINVGFRPAVEGRHRTIEAFLLDYPGEPLYGHSARLAFTHRLRPEARFDSMDDLVQQMARDVELTRALVRL